MRQHTKTTRPGPDGIPYAAWDAIGEIGDKHIADLVDEHLSGRPISDSFNNSDFAFLDKGGDEVDDDRSTGVIFRHPLDTRPLTLKNTDNKKVAHCANASITPVIVDAACELQNGFIHGRQLIQNPGDLDYAARA